MKYTVERGFSNLHWEYAGLSYHNFAILLNDLIREMVDKIGHPFTRSQQCHNLGFVMNSHFYYEFSKACQMCDHDLDRYMGIKIIEDPSLYIGDTKVPYGIVRLIYEEKPDVKQFKIKNAVNDVFGLDRGHGFQKVPHIDHVVFNGPATIVFWKDGTKTVVKHDGKGRKDKRQAILYAFVRKIYGEGKPYHNILNEIEEAIK